MASYALGDYKQCLTTLPDDNGGFAGKKDASSHDLDLQVLAIVLRGRLIITIRFRIHDANAILTFRHLIRNGP